MYIITIHLILVWDLLSILISGILKSTSNIWNIWLTWGFIWDFVYFLNAWHCICKLERLFEALDDILGLKFHLVADSSVKT